VLFFNAPDQVLIDRCLERGKTSGRSDDNEESLKHRIATYHSKSEPVVEVGFAMRCDAMRCDAMQCIGDLIGSPVLALPEAR
jgi:adenylate kinase family enzyme